MNRSPEDLIRSVANGRTELVLDHLDAGGSASDSDERGVSLIQWCAYYGDVTALRLLLDAGADIQSLGPNLDLNGAAFHGHWRLCEFLIGQGADVNFPLPDTGETALHSATSRGLHPATELVVTVLLRHDADPNIPAAVGAETGAFMRDARTKGETPLHRAAAYCDAATIRRLIEADGDPAARDVNDDTPLSWASWHQRPDAVLRLLLHGEHSIHPERSSTSDHGAGWSAMDRFLLGRPDEQQDTDRPRQP